MNSVRFRINKNTNDSNERHGDLRYGDRLFQSDSARAIRVKNQTDCIGASIDCCTRVFSPSDTAYLYADRRMLLH